MRSALLLFSCALAGLAQIQPGQPAPPEERATFRIPVNTVIAPTTVLTKKGEYVNGIQLGDFTLYDNGKPQKITADVAFEPLSLVVDVQASADLAGTARLSAVIGGVLHAVAADGPLHVFLEADPETALRLLTGTRSTVHQGTAAALESLIDLERARGSFDARLDTPTLAYAILRVSEGFLYSDVIADRVPDISRAVTVIEALLRGLDLANRAPIRERP